MSTTYLILVISFAAGCLFAICGLLKKISQTLDEIKNTRYIVKFEEFDKNTEQK